MEDKYAHLTEFQREQMLWSDNVLRSVGLYDDFQEAEAAIEQLRKINKASQQQQKDASQNTEET